MGFARQAEDDFRPSARNGRDFVRRSGSKLPCAWAARRIEGHAQALDEDGALLIRRDSGRIERVLGADLTLEKI